MKKLLVLAIASHSPVYDYFIQMFKSYMNSKPWIKSYLLFGGGDFEVKEDEIHMPVAETIKPGILHKTLWSMRHALQENWEFDYVLRTNLSTFWILDRLEKLIESLPSHNVCWGETDAKGHLGPNDPGFLTGFAMLYSRDLVEKIAGRNDWNYIMPDDVEISRKVMFSYHPQIIEHTGYHWRTNSLEELDISLNLTNISESDRVFVRIKNPFKDGMFYEEKDRLRLDPVIHLSLYNTFIREKEDYIFFGNEHKLWVFAQFFHTVVEVDVGEGFREWLTQNPYNHENLPTIKITETYQPNALVIKDGIIIVNVDHPLIESAFTLL